MVATVEKSTFLSKDITSPFSPLILSMLKLKLNLDEGGTILEIEEEYLFCTSKNPHFLHIFSRSIFLAVVSRLLVGEGK